MKRNTIFLISLLVLTACSATAPQGARVRPVDGQPYQPAFSNDGAATSYALQDTPVQAPQGNEVGFLGMQNQNSVGAPVATAGNPVFPEPTGGNWPQANQSFPQTAPQVAPNTQATQGYTAPAAVAVPNAPTTPAVAPAAPAATGKNAVQLLIDDANKAVRENRLDKAASSLERAVRLEPRNASIWYDLAQIRLHQKNYAAAEQMANKSISFTKNEELIQRNRQIIAAAQSARSAGN